MTFNSILISANEILKNHFPVLHNNPGMLTLLGAYIGLSVALYAVTSGKEFIIAGYAGVVFLLPFLKI